MVKKKADEATGNEAKEVIAAEGHNAKGAINEPLKQLFTDFEALEEQKKQISTAQSQIKARAKTEHNIPKTVFSAEIRLRKMDADVRAHFENNLKDLQNAIGYQMALDLAANSNEEQPEETEGKSYKPDPEESAKKLAAVK